jgi:hypothetical protein
MYANVASAASVAAQEMPQMPANTPGEGIAKITQCP